ncbi:MAG: TetR family transcriptional regulator [Candidatus Nanopelagicales bacterium]
MKPRGRRPGVEDTRERILTTARHLFAERGYERASMRAIAAEAHVDPALITHYFGSKQGLLTEALKLPLDPSVILSVVAQAPPADRGEQLVRVLVDTWEQPMVLRHFLGMLRTGASHEVAREVMQQTLHDSVQAAVAALVDDDPDRRSALVMTQMAGLAFTRYFLQMPDVVAFAPEELARAIGPSVQRYLTEPLG